MADPCSSQCRGPRYPTNSPRVYPSNAPKCPERTLRTLQSHQQERTLYSPRIGLTILGYTIYGLLHYQVIARKRNAKTNIQHMNITPDSLVSPHLLDFEFILWECQDLSYYHCGAWSAFDLHSQSTIYIYTTPRSRSIPKEVVDYCGSDLDSSLWRTYTRPYRSLFMFVL